MERSRSLIELDHNAPTPAVGGSGGTLTRRRVDAAGALSSSLCAVHCVIVAVFPAVLSTLSIGASVSAAFEWGSASLAVVFGATALWGAALRRDGLTGALLAAGIMGIVSGRLMESIADVELGGPVSIVSGLLLVTGHLMGLSRRVPGPTDHPHS